MNSSKYIIFENNINLSDIEVCIVGFAYFKDCRYSSLFPRKNSRPSSEKEEKTKI